MTTDKQEAVQDESDEGLRFIHLLIKLCRAPGTVTRKDWEYLDSFHLGMVEKEAGYSHKEVVHVANQIDRLQTNVSAFGRMEFVTDALMMWLIGCSFCLAGVLLGVIDIPESLYGRLVVPFSLSIGTFFIVLPFYNRWRSIEYKKDCFRKAIISILGTGLMKRSPSTSAGVIRVLKGAEKETINQVVQKFLIANEDKVSVGEKQCTVRALLNCFGMDIGDLPFDVK